MSFHSNYSDPFNEYSLPTFLEGGVIDMSNKDLVIELGQGSYSLDYNLLIHRHNIIIRGQGSAKTFLNVPINIGMIGDSIINLKGDFGEEISVAISGLTLNAMVDKDQAQAANHDLTQKETYLVKCCHAKSVIIRDVKMRIENLASTCVDIRRGFNIDIRGCEFKNYNRRWTGGGIWLRGDIENVIIEDNDFYKYGNDELIAIFNTNNFEGVNTSEEISKKNVEIRYNRFYCQDDNGGQNIDSIITETGDRGTWDGCNQRFIAVYTNQDSNKVKNALDEIVLSSTPCHQAINGIHFYNNEFHINAPLSHLFTAAFDKYTTFKDIAFRNNTIDYAGWTVEGSSSNFKELMDFCVFYDTGYASELDGDYDGFSEEPFYITGNTITCGSNIRNVRTKNGIQFYVDNHIIVDFKGTKVFFNKNTVICTREEYTSDEQSYANKGVEVFHCGGKGGEIVFSNNHCEGIKSLICWNSAGSPITLGRSWGCGNYLQGDPRITHINILECHDSMLSNEIIADYPIFFLEEFANTGTAQFIGNRVYRDISRATYFTTPWGHIYYTGTTGSNNNIQSMRLVSCDNVFDNLMMQNMYSYLQSGTMRTIHKSNVFADLYES